MLFNSFIYFIFLGIVLPLYYLFPQKSKKYLLLFASYFFYGYWDYRFLSLLLISTIVDFTVGLKLEQTNHHVKRKRLLLISLFTNLGILGIFKYYNFFIESFSPLAALFGDNLDYLHLNVILPVGISFYTFQTMSYTIDIYRKKINATKNLLDFSLFVSFFPQLVAGPIERASNLLPQIAKLSNPKKEQLKQGVVLIVFGLFKKVLIGDTTGRIVDHIFFAPANYKSIELIAALVLFSIQIYADFSGYSSIARGTAKLLGIELRKNFEQPYLSRNITEFWRRWHISLSSWLKDYLYISLGGNQKGNRRTYLNLMITMLLGGLWHGANWNFVIWGGLHGIYLAAHKYLLKGQKIAAENYQFKGTKDASVYGVKVISTFLLVLLTWLFFRATSFDITKEFLYGIIHWQPSEFSWRFISITISFMFVTLLLDAFSYATQKHTFLLFIKFSPIRYGILAGMFLTTLLFLFHNKPLPFIYFQF